MSENTLGWIGLAVVGVVVALAVLTPVVLAVKSRKWRKDGKR